VDDQQSGTTLLRPAIDPTIPRPARDLLLAHARATARPGVLPVEPEQRLATVSGAATGLTAGMVIAVTGATPWAIGVLIFQGAVAWQSATGRWALMLTEMIVMVTMVVLGSRVARFGQARTQYATTATRSRYHGRYLTDADLDAPARVLLRRAQEAVSSARAARVARAGMLVLDPALAAQEWDIAVSLREQARLRAQRAELAERADLSQPAAELLRQHQDAADEAERSTTARVEALEQFAATVGTADSAYRDWQTRARLAELGEAHLDMVARTAADAHGITELTEMTERARVIRTAFTADDAPGTSSTPGTPGGGIGTGPAQPQD
jgi:hypothetical protein